ncbi:vWA domain-containing protein [Blastococcus brunescens]|uniref:VWA domain-containing protein n=1 Tax=Blastococcus brunescens TaxID=1564165 RepID=A0ABZ1AUW6_9ACTN|nr:VWA domain-containing protein [Blastococcus sp. BMG 8361]WRL62367.1 VWA domain-containing protein [Blastococcus sp. BMG 8361]
MLLAAASTEERLRHTSFADLDADELAGMRELVRRLVLSTPVRRSRRSRASRRAGDRLDLRRTVRAAQRTGGDPVRLVHAVRRTTPRRLVLLCDVSGSMEPYTRIYLTLLQGAVAGARAEAFVFSTGLTRLTRQLAVRDPDQALARAGAASSDWAGGTRLAEGIGRFVADHGRRGLARGAVVVVLSDGWAQDDPDDVGDAMRRLRRLAHRIVWVNPRKAAPGYAPLVGGMAAALPYCDAFVSGHSLAALEQVVAAVRGAARR